jgi:hypothetical protein
MLRYLPHHQINEKSWDDCISASNERMIYAYSWYLNTVCKHWDAVVEEVEGRYISVFPLPLGRRMGRLGILQPYFTQQLGLFTTNDSKYKSIDAYLKLMPAKYKSVYLQLNTSNIISSNDDIIKTAERVTYHLSLQPTYQELVKRYRNKHKLHKAQRSDIKVRPLGSIDPLIQLFKSTKGKELSEVTEKHYRLLARLYNELKKQDAAELLQVTNPTGEAIAAALFILQPDKIIYLFSGANEEGRKTSAVTLLLDSIICKYAGSQRILDFEGSMVPSVAKFYANFGATPITYVSLIRQHTPWYLLWKEIISTS